MFDKLAEELKAARLKNDLSLKQLSARTRIDIKFLEAIEEGNFSFLPEIYVKAFIKEYASVVGLNSDIILKKYEAAKEGLPIEDITEEKTESKIESGEPVEEKTPPAEVKNIEPPKEKVHEQKEVKTSAIRSNEINSPQAPVFDSTSSSPGTFKSPGKNTYLIAGIIGGVIVLAGLVYLIFFKSSSEIIVTEKPYDQVVAESQQRYEEKPSTVADSTQNQVPVSDSLHLVIQTTDTSWVKIIVDNSKAEEFILFPKAQKSLAANTDFRITFGRSSAIKLLLNNKPLEFKPKSKSVSYVLINSKGLEFLEKPPAKGNE
jgi:cytoskeletal protein RodZ